MKTQLPFFCFVLKLLIFSPLNLNSQEVIFSKVAEMNPVELGYEGVTDIAQDSDGYMWFATLNGLYRYNGYRVTAYRNDPRNPNSLANNHLNSIFIDDSGLIWIGTFGKGMDCLNPNTGVFKHYRYNSKDKKSISSDSVIVIRAGKEGTLWLGTMNGLNDFDIHTGKSTRYMHNEKDPNSISHPQVRTIYTDKEGTTWFGTASPFYNEGGFLPFGGLNRFNPTKRNFTRYLHDPKNPNTLVNNHVTALFEDSRGNFWVGTMGDGLHIMDRKKGTFKRLTYDPAYPEKLSRPPLRFFVPYAGDFISFINEDPNHNIWIGTFSGGINRFDPHTKKITFFDATGKTNNGLTARCFLTSYLSRDSVLWIAPWLEQLYKIDPYQKKLPFVSFGGQLCGVIKKTSDVIWLYGDMGLIRKDLKAGTEKIYTHDPKNPNSLSNNYVCCIEESKNRKWWIATANGLDYFDPQTESFIHYQHNPNHKNSLSHNMVTSVRGDGQNLWIATPRGLDLLNLSSGKFTPYIFGKDGSKNTLDTLTRQIYVKDKNLIWLVKTRGISVFDVKKGVLSKKQYLEDKYISSIFKDHQGTIWVTSTTGLFWYDSGKDEFIRFIDPHHFTNLELTIDIQEDNKKNLWVLSHSSIYKINPKRDCVYTYGSDYGVQKYLFYGLSNINVPSDEVFFIHSYSYVNFNENELKSNPVPPQIAIDEIQIAGDSTNNGAATKRILYNQHKLGLKYRQNTFSITFSPIHYANPLGNKIIFKLDKIDTDWRESGNEGKAYYFNLPPNTYTFRLKACNSTGILTERNLTITITPPWWRTWWAYVIYLLLFALAGWRVHLYQKERTIKKEREKNQARELEQAKAIEKAYTELAEAHNTLKSTQAQLIQSEKLASLGELTAGIAHEIQNPLNFVNNFAEVSAEMLDEMHEELEKGDTTEAIAIATDLKTNLEKINHHGQRASSIVKGMLEHSRASTGVKAPTDLNALADEYLRLAYHGLRAKDNNFNAVMETHFDPDLPLVSVIPQDIGRVLLNLINNAFYAIDEKQKQMATVESRTPLSESFRLSESYTPTISLRTKRLDNAVEIRIQDNGGGIPEAIRDKIFQPFFTTKPTGQGTGLGLSLAYDIVTKGHGGTLDVESEEEKGTVFIIRLPTKSNEK